MRSLNKVRIAAVDPFQPAPGSGRASYITTMLQELKTQAAERDWFLAHLIEMALTQSCDIDCGHVDAKKYPPK